MPLNRPFSEGPAIIVAAVDSHDKSSAMYVCSGVADDVDIQAAIDALPASGGRVILLDGSFETIADITVPEYVTLEGQGKSTIIKPDGGAITQGIDVTGDHVTIKNLKVEMQAGVGTGGARPNGIHISAHHHCTLEDLWIYGDITEADDGSDDRQNGIFIDVASYHKIINVRSENNDRHGLCIDGASTYNQIIGGCYEGNIVNGIMFTTGAVNNLVDGCVVRANTGEGILIIDSNENVIAGSQILSSGLNGISILRSSYCTINGNEVLHHGSDGINITGDGTVNSDYNIVIGNTNRGNSESGIEVAGGTYANYNTIAGNQLHDNVGDNFADAGNETDAYSREIAYYDNLVVTTAAHVVNNEDLSAGTPITFTLAAQPDCPRFISWHFDSHAQITEFTITIIGVNARGIDVTQTITEADGWDGEFAEAYATITSIIMSARTGTGALDTMDIGVVDDVGLPNEIFAVTDVYKCTKNGADYSGAGNITPELVYHTVDLSTGAGIGAGDNYVIYYRKHKNQVQ